jgi:hypothetical protein
MKRERSKSAKRRHAGNGALKPIPGSGREIEPGEEEEGPRGWFLPTVEASYARLVPREASPPPSPKARPAPGKKFFASSLQPGEDESVLAEVRMTVWRERLEEYRRRKSALGPRPAPAGAAPAMPVVPGGRNWLPLGPTLVLDGQTVGGNPIAGRVGSIAVATGGQILYAASANGGVFRSDDGGTSWRSLMDGFDLDPRNFASSSLACGAIALDPADPNRVYVGTGEGDTHEMFRKSLRIVNALPAYRGIGPIRSDDGGATWSTEPTQAGSPELAGEAFFALAVDPRNRDNVVGATTQGLYQRVSRNGGGYEWVRRRPGVHSSVVVTFAGGTARFFAAEWGQGVVSSTDGASWTPAGQRFPSASVGRIALGVQADNPNLVYGFVADDGGALLGVFRLDGVNGAWKAVSKVPDVLPGGQGDYDLAIAVDPQNADLIYLAGDFANVDPYPGSIWRCAIQAAGATYKVRDSASIGTHAHADVHFLIHTPGDPTELWCGCDGGVFLNRDPRGTGEFASQNAGLSCLCSNFIAQHPTDPNILFTGLQDNGTARTGGGPTWTHVNWGDGGYCLINWAKPKLVLVFANGTVYRSTSGGTSHDSWSKSWKFPWATMTEPIVSTPYNPASPSDADLVAVGAGSQVTVSTDFAASWTMQMTLPGGSAVGSVYALAFASPTRLFIGTTRGEVFRADRSGNAWTLTRLDNVSPGPLGLVGLISDIAIDWADATLGSVYVVFGGMGDQRRVWRFDGARWEARSGTPGGTGLLDVEHNALVVDRADPNQLYVGADIGVWHSADRGLNWTPFENGLPDAPVFDLQIHSTQRLLRAATHGRGLYEIPL